MSLEQSEAIVLRAFPVAEQDKIVVFFTREKGLIRGVAKGARKFGNRFGSSFEPMSHIKIFYYEKEGQDLVTISEADLIESFFEIQQDLKVAFTLSYFAELVEEFCPSLAKDDRVFRLLLSTLQTLEKKGDLNFLSRYFEAWLLKINGYLPDISLCQRCRAPLAGMAWLAAKKDGICCEACAIEKKDEAGPEVRRFLQWIRKNRPPQEADLPLTAAQLESVGKMLQRLIVFHLEREPRTLRFLKT